MEGMNGIVNRLVGTVQLPGHPGSRLALGTGEEALTAPDGKGGR
jgi:hypothetical protein